MTTGNGLGLPGFAAFLLENHLQEVAETALQISRDLDVPLLKHLDKPDEELIGLLIPGYRELLTAFINGTSEDLIVKGIRSWTENQLSVIERDQVALDDIPLIALARKRVLLHFLPRYTNDIAKAIQIVSEIDDYVARYTWLSFGAYTKIFGTERKAVEQRLEENQNFIQRIADAAPAVITSYNLKTGQYLFVSQGLEKILGYSPQQVLEEGINFFVRVTHPDDFKLIMEKNARAVEAANNNWHRGKEEPVEEFQYRIRHADGEYRWFHTFGTVFSRNVQGEVDNILNISLDITEKIKADEILMQKTVELQQSNQSLQEFAFIASHDLKEPLRKISTLTDRLVAIENVNLSHDGKIYLQKVIRSSIRMQQMVDELLALAQVTNDRDFQSVDLQTVLTDVLQTFDQKVEETKSTVVCKGLPRAMVVPSQFRQLFQNLISNSLKFRKPDTPVRIEITHKYLGSGVGATHNLPPAGRYLQLTFTDNGIGFDNRFLPKIFSIFQRLHPRTKYEGNGIGLAICKKIVENHGGVILADGVVDQGARFQIIIPDRK